MSRPAHDPAWRRYCRYCGGPVVLRHCKIVCTEGCRTVLDCSELEMPGAPGAPAAAAGLPLAQDAAEEHSGTPNLDAGG
jgi:hypothetical protein